MGIMDCSVDELAKHMVSNHHYYNVCLAFLEGMRQIDPGNSGLEDALKKVEEAHKTATEYEYFVFVSTWTWPERSGEANGEGYSVYQKINGNLVEALTFTNGIPTEEEVLDFLKKMGAKKVFTAYIPHEGYLGLSNEDVDHDGDVIDRRPLEHFEYSIFKEEGIEVVYVPD